MSGAAASVGASRIQNFMNHPAGGSAFTRGLKSFLNVSIFPTGPKTVFFWAPLMKWCLVAAGLKDLSRPADKLSISQNVGVWSSPTNQPSTTENGSAALAATGFIWVRYSLIITPVNYSLAGVSYDKWKHSLS